MTLRIMIDEKRIKSSKLLITSLLALVFLCTNLSSAFAQDHGEEAEEFNASETIVHHVLDDHIWHFFDGHYGTVYLPIIAYSSEKGLDVFSSRNFYDDHHNLVDYKGYSLEHGLSITDNHEASVLDLSMTKNVTTLLIVSLIMILVFTSVAKGYKTNRGKAPKGIQAVFEPIIVYLRDEVIKPNIGDHYEKFFPYLLTLFFFILFGNIFGLIPGASNMTGNIAVTLVLALFTFFITNVKGNKGYWGHIFNPPGVPLWLKPLIVLIEIIGIFTKPISLTVRLFVAITAGHIVMLSLISLTFIFGSYAVGGASSLIVLFISLIEILVALIQAYVFTMFSALYIGLATAKAEHH